MGGSALHPVLELIRGRVTVERFDPSRPLSEEQIRSLVRDATEAPSSFNIQHWRFVAVRDPADKQQLMEVAYGQSQVAEAAVTFIVLGDLHGVDKLPEAMDLAVRQGALPSEKADAWIEMASRLYADEQMARDEAIRSCSLAAMTMMLAAEAQGLAVSPLVGFDPDQLRERFAVDECYLPVMLLAVGYPARVEEVRKPRFPEDAVLAFDRCRRF